MLTAAVGSAWLSPSAAAYMLRVADEVLLFYQLSTG